MESRKIIVGLLILIMLGIGTYFALTRNLIPFFSSPDGQTEIDIANWKLYRSEQYGFEIKYPTNLEPLEKRALSFNNSPELQSLFNICFGSVNMDEFYCDFELYVAPNTIASSKNLELWNANSFLGLALCPVDRSLPRPRFDNVDGYEIDTCEAGSFRRNVFVVKDSFLYLLTTEPEVGNVSKKDKIFYGMINSFKFIDSLS